DPRVSGSRGAMHPCKLGRPTVMTIRSRRSSGGQPPLVPLTKPGAGHDGPPAAHTRADLHAMLVVDASSGSAQVSHSVALASLVRAQSAGRPKEHQGARQPSTDQKVDVTESTATLWGSRTRPLV